jgi:hypothetical protein
MMEHRDNWKPQRPECHEHAFARRPGEPVLRCVHRRCLAWLPIRTGHFTGLPL